MKNTIRTGLFVVLFACITGTGFAQQGDADKRLLEKFSQDKLTQMQKDDPEAYSFWTYYLDHGYSIQDMPKGKGADLPEVSIADANNFNLLTLKIEPQKVGNRYFRIKETGKLLAVHSWTEVKTNWKESKK